MKKHLKLFTITFITLISTPSFANSLYYVYTDSLTNIRIHFDDKPPLEFRKINRYTPVKNDSITKSFIFLISDYMRKYPPHVMKENLLNIYICDSFRSNGVPLGGQANRSRKCIILAIQHYNLLSQYDLYKFERLFHHEFSHLFFHRNIKYFNEKKWTKENGRKYSKHLWKSLKNKKNIALALDTALFRFGFLNEYSQKNIREDFATFSELMFTPDTLIYKYLHLNERVQNKYNMVVSFFNQSDPIFTNEYFQNLKPCISTRSD